MHTRDEAPLAESTWTYSRQTGHVELVPTSTVRALYVNLTLNNPTNGMVRRFSLAVWKSNRRSFVESPDIAGIYRPSADQRGAKSPFDPGSVET